MAEESLVFVAYMQEPRQDMYLIMVQKQRFYIFFNDRVCAFNKENVKTVDQHNTEIKVVFQDGNRIVFQSRRYAVQLAKALKAQKVEPIPVEIVSDGVLKSDSGEEQFPQLKVQLCAEQLVVKNARGVIVFHDEYTGLREVQKTEHGVLLQFAEQEHNFYITDVRLESVDDDFVTFIQLLNQNKWRMANLHSQLQGTDGLLFTKEKEPGQAKQVEIMESSDFFTQERARATSISRDSSLTEDAAMEHQSPSKKIEEEDMPKPREKKELKALKFFDPTKVKPRGSKSTPQKHSEPPATPPNPSLTPVRKIAESPPQNVEWQIRTGEVFTAPTVLQQRTPSIQVQLVQEPYSNFHAPVPSVADRFYESYLAQSQAASVYVPVLNELENNAKPKKKKPAGLMEPQPPAVTYGVFSYAQMPERIARFERLKIQPPSRVQVDESKNVFLKQAGDEGEEVPFEEVLAESKRITSQPVKEFSLKPAAALDAGREPVRSVYQQGDFQPVRTKILRDASDSENSEDPLAPGTRSVRIQAQLNDSLSAFFQHSQSRPTKPYAFPATRDPVQARLNLRPQAERPVRLVQHPLEEGVPRSLFVSDVALQGLGGSRNVPGAETSLRAPGAQELLLRMEGLPAVDQDNLELLYESDNAQPQNPTPNVNSQSHEDQLVQSTGDDARVNITYRAQEPRIIALSPEKRPPACAAKAINQTLDGSISEDRRRPRVKISQRPENSDEAALDMCNSESSTSYQYQQSTSALKNSTKPMPGQHQDLKYNEWYAVEIGGDFQIIGERKKEFVVTRAGELVSRRHSTRIIAVCFTESQVLLKTVRGTLAFPGTYSTVFLKSCSFRPAYK